jgi:hypothetical protein
MCDCCVTMSVMAGRADTLRGDYVGRLGYVLELIQTFTYIHGINAEVCVCVCVNIHTQHACIHM